MSKIQIYPPIMIKLLFKKKSSALYIESIRYGSNQFFLIINIELNLSSLQQRRLGSNSCSHNNQIIKKVKIKC